MEIYNPHKGWTVVEEAGMRSWQNTYNPAKAGQVPTYQPQEMPDVRQNNSLANQTSNDAIKGLSQALASFWAVLKRAPTPRDMQFIRKLTGELNTYVRTRGGY